MHYVSLNKSGGWTRNEKGRHQTKIPYAYSDNHFYWFHKQDKNTFYVVPQIELIDRGYLTNKDNKGKISLYIGSKALWLNCYKFHYDTINDEENKEELMLLLGLI